jgi:hypothetical protein
LWLKLGDKNISLFHKQSKDKQLGNNLKEIIQANGRKIIDFDPINEEAYNHFKEIYTIAEDVNSIVVE